MNKIYDLINSDIKKYENNLFICELRAELPYKKENLNCVTYKNFINKSKAIASYLISHGYANKKILVLGKNSIEYLLTDFAVSMYVGICFNKDVSTSALELSILVKEYGLDLIICDKKIENEISLHKIQCDIINFEWLYDCSEKILVSDDMLIHKKYDEIAKVFFTSGSTSMPKGIPLSMKNMFSGFEYFQRRTPFIQSKEIIYLCLPLHHTYANVYNFYCALYSGLTIYLCKDMKNIIGEMEEVRPTIFCGVPLLYERFIPQIERLKAIESLKYMYCGGAKLELSLKETYHNAGLHLIDAYAMTETGSSFALHPVDIDYREESVGTIYENLDVKIIDINNGIGEIVVKGDPVFSGYYMNEEATKNVFTEDGYFKTNDLGYIENNKLFITGRKDKRIAFSNGENIYTDDIVSWFKAEDKNIIDIKVSDKNGKITLLFYVSGLEYEDVNLLVQKYNKNKTKKDTISEFDVKQKHEKLMGTGL